MLNTDTVTITDDTQPVILKTSGDAGDTGENR